MCMHQNLDLHFWRLSVFFLHVRLAHQFITLLDQGQLMSDQKLRTIGDYQYNPQFCVGEGAFGKVYKGKKLSDGRTVAIKKLDAGSINRDSYLRDALEVEISILKRLKHQNIVEFIDKLSTDRSIYIITEFCADGDLKSLMRNRRVEEAQTIEIFTQLAAGFKVLVSEKIIHRDLKPANILNHRGQVKIADFGFAKIVQNFGVQLMRTCVGTPIYMSPQVLNKQLYTTKSDIWSLGVIYFEMLFGKLPWYGTTEDQLKKNLKTQPLELPKDLTISKFSEEFLKKALEKEEAIRMDWDQVFLMFEQQARFSTGSVIFKEIKNKPQQAIQNSPDFSGKLNELNNQRQYLSYNHFLNVEMIQSIPLINSIYKKELQFELFCLLSSKSTFLQYWTLSLTVKQMIETQKQGGVLAKYQTLIDEEAKLCKELMDDTKQYFEKMGLLQNLRSMQDYQLMETDVTQLERLTQFVLQKASTIVKQILNAAQGANTQLEFEVLQLLDNILDLILASRVAEKCQQIDFTSINDKSGWRSRTQEYQNSLMDKLKNAFNY